LKQPFISIVGHNSSGKTTLAKKLETDFGFSRVSGDDLRGFVCKDVAYFQGTPWDYPNERTRELNPLVAAYRLELSRVLLRAGQHVLYDGSGSTRKIRKQYLDKVQSDFPNTTRVIIWADLSEAELVARLGERGGKWLQQYQDIKIHSFEEPEVSETDILLRYDQHNYDTLAAQLRTLLDA